MAAHAALHGPAGRPELRDDDYWAAEIAWFEGGADDQRPGHPTAVPPSSRPRAQRDRERGESPTQSGRGVRPDLREDFVHDLLADLARRMIDLNERKHAEKQGFLSWLERTLGCRIADLSGKSLLADYDDRAKLSDFADLCRRLCTAANRRKMTADPQGRALQERIAGEYTASMAKLDALNADLAATDTLINRIVYALYGLGPEEIAIIEETTHDRAGQT